MKVITWKLPIVMSSVLIAALFGSCQKDEPTLARTPINSFSMMIDQQLWEPFQDEENPCRSTYLGTYGMLNTDPMYTIYAYDDPEGTEDTDSDTFLRTRIMNVNDTGTYTLDGSYHNDFDSYFIFVSNQSGEKKRYVNRSQRAPFNFYVEEIVPIEGLDSRGFKGSFEGVLYNEEDPQDSLIISQGQFQFNVVNHNDHCGL